MNSEPPSSGSAAQSAADGRRHRRRVWLTLAAVTVAMGSYQGLRGLVMPYGEGPLRFTLQAEPRPLPVVAFADGDGRTTDLTQLRGKVVLLNIWATWCAPCRKEMPSLDRLQGQLGSADFEVIALSIDTGDKASQAIRSFYASVGIRHLRIHQAPPGSAGVDLASAGVPITLLLDRQGRELGRMTGAAAWDSPEALAFVRKQVAQPTR